LTHRLYSDKVWSGNRKYKKGKKMKEKERARKLWKQEPDQ